MLALARAKLEALRDQLRSRGQRPSMLIPTASANLIEAMEIVEEFGALCEAMYLMMLADRKVLNVEREVLRGALDVLSSGRVRTAHMEAMIDAAARRVAEEGEERRMQRVVDVLSEDPVRAETAVVLAAAVAAADGRITKEETAVLDALARGLGLGPERANRILEELTTQR
jgi:tellurite resistance protein